LRRRRRVVVLLLRHGLWMRRRIARIRWLGIRPVIWWLRREPLIIGVIRTSLVLGLAHSSEGRRMIEIWREGAIPLLNNNI
jgi:hypothetical protein